MFSPTHRAAPIGARPVIPPGDSYHRWREDIELLKSMHLKAYRFSVAWTRIAPTGGTDWNEKGFAYYDGLVNTLLEAGIEPYITLYHWDLPRGAGRKGRLAE